MGENSACLVYYSAVLAAGQPTAVSNLPVVTSDRHKAKQKKEKSGATEAEKKSASKDDGGNNKK
jgi:hypothetical protein